MERNIVLIKYTCKISCRVSKRWCEWPMTPTWPFNRSNGREMMTTLKCGVLVRIYLSQFPNWLPIGLIVRKSYRIIRTSGFSDCRGHEKCMIKTSEYDQLKGKVPPPPHQDICVYASGYAYMHQASRSISGGATDLKSCLG
jgi:hypothetical protein